MNINRLKDLREDHDLTQKQVANILKTTQQQYSKYEIGIRLIPIDKLEILANLYHSLFFFMSIFSAFFHNEKTVIFIE